MMDHQDSITILMKRLQHMGSVRVINRIVGYILMQQGGEQEIVNLASAPDNVFYPIIHQVKNHLEQSTNNWKTNLFSLSPLNPSQSLIPLSPSSPPVPFQNPPTYSNPWIVPNWLKQAFDASFEFKLLGLRIVAVLKSRKGASVSLDSLPSIYFHYFGKTLEAEGITDHYGLTRLIESVQQIQVIKRHDGKVDVALKENYAAEGLFSENDIPNSFKNYQDIFEPPKSLPIHSGMGSEFQSMSLSRGYDNSKLVRNWRMAEQERYIEYERRQLALTEQQLRQNQYRTNSRLNLPVTNRTDLERYQKLSLPGRPFGDSQI